jgi:hypothetical protein
MDLAQYPSQTWQQAVVLRSQNQDDRTILRRLVAAVFTNMIVIACFGINLLLHLLRLVIRLDRDYSIRKRVWKFLEALWSTPEAQMVVESGYRLVVVARKRAEDVGNGISDAVEGRGALRRLFDSFEDLRV